MDVPAELPPNLKRRLGDGYRSSQNRRPHIPTPYDTALVKGLPQGMTVVFGDPGGGKSTFSRDCALHAANLGHKVLYVYAESYSDKDTLGVHENLMPIDYCTFLPNNTRAVEEVFGKWDGADKPTTRVAPGYIHYLGADLVVLDSLTTFLSSTRKAVEEADVRGGAFDVNRICEIEQVAVIGVSQARGAGQYTNFAGGTAVGHSGAMVLELAKKKVEARWDAERYQQPEGSIVFTFEVKKDRTGVARQNDVFVAERIDGRPRLTSIRDLNRPPAQVLA